MLLHCSSIFYAHQAESIQTIATFIPVQTAGYVLLYTLKLVDLAYLKIFFIQFVVA